MTVTNSRELKAINVRFSMYHDLDVGTGRCRLPKSLFKMLGIGIGSIIVIKLGICPEVDILCTCWPDMQEYLDNDKVVIDDTVYTGILSSWKESNCKVSFLCSSNKGSIYPERMA